MCRQPSSSRACLSSRRAGGSAGRCASGAGGRAVVASFALGRSRCGSSCRRAHAAARSPASRSSRRPAAPACSFAPWAGTSRSPARARRGPARARKTPMPSARVGRRRLQRGSSTPASASARSVGIGLRVEVRLQRGVVVARVARGGADLGRQLLHLQLRPPAPAARSAWSLRPTGRVRARAGPPAPDAGRCP